jgi:deferrochelatase/peroxidase EfeB
MAGQLQRGIYHASGSRPGKFFAILFLRAARDLDARVVGEAFAALWAIYQGLRRGEVRDLPGHPVPPGRLTVLVGFGRNIFALPNARHPLPSDLGDQHRFRSPLPTGGGTILAGSGLAYADDVRANPATEDIAVQFIADTQLAVDRAIVETWKALADGLGPDPAAPLLLTTFYTGFQRDDGRSWIDFHDGLSNMRSQERPGAITIKPSPLPADAWTAGGTYLAFLRLGVDLAVWRTLDRRQQELHVGRDKLSGCPLASLDGQGQPVPQTGCPIVGTREVTAPGNEAQREHPPAADPALQQSHVHRANHLAAPPTDRNSLRIFRQGYEFLEPVERAPGFRAGLNFVSFQDTPERLFRMLFQPTWLGSTNFGGDPNRQLPGMERLLSVQSGGVFLVPPMVRGAAFPGSSILL